MDDDGSSDIEQLGMATAQGSAQPSAFLKPPRFKAIDADTTDAAAEQCQLPQAFSPQRRGVKYVPGGLAAGLRDWLLQIKGADDSAEGTYAARIIVEELRAAPGMTLVQGRPLRNPVAGDAGTVRAILAGEGRLSGLARNNVVHGCIVGVAQPAWEVETQDERWVVACDWAVLQDGMGE